MPITSRDDTVQEIDPATRSDAAVAPPFEASKGVEHVADTRATSGSQPPDAGSGSAALVRGVADAIVRLAAPASAPTGSGPPAAPGSPDDPTDLNTAIAPARTLTLQLNPGSLGTVSVRLHIIGGALDVQLGVSDPQTLGLLGRERDTLVAALRDQSTTIHSLIIQASDVPLPEGHDAPSQRTAGDQASGNRSSGGAGAGQPGEQGHQPAPDRRTEERRPDALAAAAPDAGSALFV